MPWGFKMFACLLTTFSGPNFATNLRCHIFDLHGLGAWIYVLNDCYSRTSSSKRVVSYKHIHRIGENMNFRSNRSQIDCRLDCIAQVGRAKSDWRGRPNNDCSHAVKGVVNVALTNDSVWLIVMHNSLYEVIIILVEIPFNCSHFNFGNV